MSKLQLKRHNKESPAICLITLNERMKLRWRLETMQKNGAKLKSLTSRKTFSSIEMIYKEINLLVILVVMVFLFSGCASVVSTSLYDLSINSNPENAKVSITDKKGKEIYLGSTPALVSLKSGYGFFSKAEYTVKLSAPGYDDRIIPINFRLDEWYLGNILFGGFIGGLIGMLIVDPATGAMWKIETEFINETLSESATSLSPELKIININEIPENWQAHLVKIN